MGTTNSQVEQIKDALEAGETIDPRSALHRFGTMRLAARINDIKNKYGLDIRTKMVKGVANYVLQPDRIVDEEIVDKVKAVKKKEDGEKKDI